MSESDLSDGGDGGVAGKRPREDSSGDENLEVPSKRPRSELVDQPDPLQSGKDAVPAPNGTVDSSEEPMDTDDKMKEESVDTGNKIKEDQDAADKTLEDNKEAEDVGEKIEKPKPEENGGSQESMLEKDEEKEGKKDSKNTEPEDDKEHESVDAAAPEQKPQQKPDSSEKEGKKSGKEEKKDTSSVNNRNDSEVVDGLELSVECASDKEASSSESEKDEAAPRPKTIIIKAKPNDSELDVSPSEAEGSGEEEAKEKSEMETKKPKRKMNRKSFTKVKSSGSEESSENNSDDEDYSPNSKKKLKKSVPPKKAVPKKQEAKKGRGGGRKKSVKDSEEEKSESNDEDMSLAEWAKRATPKGKQKAIKKSKEKTDSSSEDEEAEDGSESESDAKKTKNNKQKQKDVRPEDDSKIKSLKKYMNVAGIRVKYTNLWAGCKSNKERAQRITDLLRESGIEGRITLEKCKKLKIKREVKADVISLDASNIISEGRITRARRAEVAKKPPSPLSPTRQREAKNAFRRIQAVCDSESE